MQSIIETLTLYFNYPFVRYALLVGVLISLCSSLLGVPLVLKRYSFIGDGLSHVAFGAMAIATVFSVGTEMIIVLPITVIAAILLLKKGKNTLISGDASLAMLSVGALALGYLILNLFSKSANLAGDVCSTLFGSTSILTLTKMDVGICILMSVIVLLVFILFYQRIFAVTFDEDFLAATTGKAQRWNLLIAIITAVIIVLAMKLVGSLLISALVVFPALSAMRLFHTFRMVVVCAGVLSVLCAVFGILVSILFSTPVGATIVTIHIIVYFIFNIINRVMKGAA